MVDDRSKWLARATTQFARTVYTELRRAGHSKPDVIRFVNALVDEMCRDTSQDLPLTAPELVDAEAGIPDASSLMDLLDFELRARLRDRRSDVRLAILAIDVVLPAFTPSSVRQATHVRLAAALASERRTADSFGQLGPDRYLMLLPRAREGVRASVEARIARRLEHESPGLAEGVALDLRWVVAGPGDVTSVGLVQECIATAPTHLRAPLQRRVDAPAAAPPIPRPPVRREIVVALGGGAARAVSHAGVLQVLADASVHVVAVAGCSAGALVGAMFARGMTPAQIADRFAAFSATPLYREMRAGYAAFLRAAMARERRTRPRYFNASSLAFFSDTALSALSDDLLFGFVEHFVGTDCDIARIPVPFSLVATDLAAGRAVRLSHGSLIAALAASCAVPGLFPPQRLGERVLIDGAALTEVPIWAAFMAGVAAPVLAVHMGRPFNRVVDFQTSTEVSSRATALAHAELVREQLRHADVLLTIPMDDVGWLDFRRADKIVEAGRIAALEALPRILAHVERPPDRPRPGPSGGVDL